MGMGIFKEEAIREPQKCNSCFTHNGLLSDLLVRLQIG